MKIAILQSNYIPWKGYFDIISRVDLFIFHDDLQYTKNDWRNRNKIKTDKGAEWLTVPCGADDKRLICNVQLQDSKWQKDHWNKICLWYRRASFFKQYAPFFEGFYLNRKWDNLSDMNQYLITEVSKNILMLNTRFEDSRKYELKLAKAERVKELLLKAGATEYLSGPSGKNYLNAEMLEKEKIQLSWMDYSSYPEYPQLYPPFEHHVSILDLIFNTGKEAINYLSK